MSKAQNAMDFIKNNSSLVGGIFVGGMALAVSGFKKAGLLIAAVLGTVAALIAPGIVNALSNDKETRGAKENTPHTANSDQETVSFNNSSTNRVVKNSTKLVQEKPRRSNQKQEAKRGVEDTETEEVRIAGVGNPQYAEFGAFNLEKSLSSFDYVAKVGNKKYLVELGGNKTSDGTYNDTQTHDLHGHFSPLYAKFYELESGSKKYVGDVKMNSYGTPNGADFGEIYLPSPDLYLYRETTGYFNKATPKGAASLRGGGRALLEESFGNPKKIPLDRDFMVVHDEKTGRSMPYQHITMHNHRVLEKFTANAIEEIEKSRNILKAQADTRVAIPKQTRTAISGGRDCSDASNHHNTCNLPKNQASATLE